MKLGWKVPGSAAAGLLALSTVAAASPALVAPAGAQPAVAAASPAAEGANGGATAGKQVFQDVCGSCHDAALSTDQKKNREDWQVTVSRMVSNGAGLSDDQVAQVVDYLAQNYGTK